MPQLKKLLASVLMSLCFTAFANQGGAGMEAPKTLVLGYDYPSERTLKESTSKLHQNSNYTFHGNEKNVEVVLLGEKEKVIIPEINESFLHFDKNLVSASLHLLPAGHYLSLTPAIEKIKETREKLAPLKAISLNSKEFDLDKLNDEYFASRPAELLGMYELDHTKIFFVMKKLDTPKEIHPRDKDYFQLIIRIDNKNK